MNVGLTKIIMYSVPVLMFLYPLAIAMIVLTLFSSKFHHSKIIYQCTIFFTMIAALMDLKLVQSSFQAHHSHKL